MIDSLNSNYKFIHPKYVDIDLITSVDWAEIIRPKDVLNLDISLAEIILVSAAERGQWYFCRSAVDSFTMKAVNLKVSRIMKPEEDRHSWWQAHEKASKLFVLIRSKFPERVSVKDYIFTDSEDMSYEEVFSEYANFMEDRNFDPRIHTVLGIPSLIKFIGLKTEDDFVNKLHDLNLERACEERRVDFIMKDMVSLIISSFYKNIYSLKLLSISEQILTRENKSSIARFILSVRLQYSRVKSTENCDGKQELYSFIECSRVFFSEFISADQHLAWSAWDSILEKEDIPYIMPKLDVFGTCGDKFKTAVQNLLI